MKATFILFFILLGMLQFGILLNALSAYRTDYRPVSLKYWSIALSLSAISYLIFAAAIATSEDLLSNSNILITVGNTLIFASVLFQGLFAKTLRSEISIRIIWFLIAIIVSYGIIFEFVRHYGTFESRTAIVGILIFVIYLWQIYEIRETRKSIKSFNLDVLFWLIIVESFFILARAVAAYIADANVQFLNQIPVIVSLLLWIQLTLNILAYVTMVGFWVEEITKKNVASELENTKIKALLEEKDRLLQNLIQTKKMAELGAMSASISHEINQPLAAIKLNAWSIKRSHDLDPNLTDMQSNLIEQTVKDIDRVADIVATLRAVFKDRKSQTKIIVLHDYIEKLKPLIETEFGTRSIKVQYDIPTSLRVIFNENELTLVLLNLVNNAARANAHEIIIRAKAIEKQVTLSIEDDGDGVLPDMVPQLFEINKEPSGSSGLGLGLWLARYIMERGEGSIEYRDNKPKGSIFTLTMPNAA